MINQDWEYWLDRVNENLEKLLENNKKENDIQRRVAKHYAMRNQIARAKLKRA